MVARTLLRRMLLPLVALGVFAPGGAQAEEGPKTIELQVPDRISNLRRVDATGDGREDLLLLSGRQLLIFAAAEGQSAPAKAPMQRIALPSSVSFVDGGGPDGGAGVISLGTEGLLHHTAEAQRVVDATVALGWRDTDRPSFAAMRRDGGRLLPMGTRYQWREGTGRLDARVAPARRIAAAGDFVEDESTVTTSWPEAFIGRAPDDDATKAIWLLDGRALRATHAKGETRYDLAFLPTEGDRRLVDLDGDRLPDLLHRKTTNKTGEYAFFRTRPAAAGATTGPSHRPSLSFLKLSGFQLDPALVDLDGDGDLDFVITTIEVDAKNMLRAIQAGRVTAQTQAFLNQGPTKGFPQQPDAVVRSDVGVKLRFTYSGSIEVERTLTIVADGDFNGDGRLDLAIRTGPAELTIREGKADGVWDATGRKVSVPAPQGQGNLEGYSVDLDGNRRHELVLVYRGEAGAPDRVIWLRP